MSPDTSGGGSWVKNGVRAVAVVAVGGLIGWSIYRENNPPRPPKPEPALARVIDSDAWSLRESHASIAARTLYSLHSQNPDTNVACSPSGLHAVATALSMGADGALKTKLEKLVGKDAPANITNYQPRRRDLERRGVLLGGTGIWAISSGMLTADYTRRFEAVFEFEPRVAPIGSGPVPDIDAWLKKQTVGKVASLGPMGPGPWTAFLVDSKTFRDRWLVGFDPAKTTDRPFTLASGKDVSTPTMEGKELSYEFAETEELARLEFPFRNHLSFIALVPKKGLESLLKSPELEQGLRSISGKNPMLGRRSVGRIAMPKWKIEKSNDLKTLLDSLGITGIFGSRAGDDLRKMFTGGESWPSDGKQTVGIEIDENGAEAFAYTTTRMISKGTQPKSHNFVIDQPFVFAIVDPQGPIFFAGIIMDPRSNQSRPQSSVRPGS